MIFGFFKKSDDGANSENEEPEVEAIQFKGAVNGKEAKLDAHSKVVSAGLIPLKELLTDALSRRAELVRVEPKGAQAPVVMQIDGISYPGGKLPRQEALAITQVLKLLAGLDPKVRKTTQQGGIKAEFESKPYELDVITSPLGDAERLTVRVLNQSLKLDTPTDVGMSDDIRKKIRELASSPGVLLAVGPANSGLTTTMYAALRAIDSFIYSVFLLFDIGTRKLNNVNKFEAKAEDSLATTLDRIARIEAHVAVPERLSDAETAKVLFSKADVLMLMSEMTAKDVCHAAAQLSEWVPDKAQLSERLKGLLSTKLIRMLCTDCKQAFRPNPEFLKKAGLPATVATLYRRPVEPQTPEPDYQPCQKCGGSGYFGRTALFEFLDITEGVKAILASEKVDPAKLRAQMRQDKMLTFQQDGLRLVSEGKTALEELQRIFKTPA